MTQNSLIIQNRTYWTHRASGYSAINQRELGAPYQRCQWQKVLCQEMVMQFPNRSPSSLRVLDIGCGPGFFSIVLAELGYKVTAIDLTPAMLEEARCNAGETADGITFLEMDAEKLAFPDGSFDAIVTRNLTWNLPHPEEAYREWVRVLRKDGLLMNFDANWYHYLYEETALQAYKEDRIRTRELGLKDDNVGENFDVMEEIARSVPLSRINRPIWDQKVLTELGLDVTINEQIWNDVWSPQEQANFSSTPMFLVCGRKHA